MAGAETRLASQLLHLLQHPVGQGSNPGHAIESFHRGTLVENTFRWQDQVEPPGGSVQTISQVTLSPLHCCSSEGRDHCEGCSDQVALGVPGMVTCARDPSGGFSSGSAKAGRPS